MADDCPIDYALSAGYGYCTSVVGGVDGVGRDNVLTGRTTQTFADEDDSRAVGNCVHGTRNTVYCACAHDTYPGKVRV